MSRIMLGVGSVLFCCSLVSAQTAQPLPSFEVASIKPAAPMTAGRFMIGTRGGPGTQDPGQMTFSNVTVRDLIQNGYDVKMYQVSGPNWIETERFDIKAKVPMGTTKEQSRLMIQDLLAERFKVVLHHTTKELPLYALVVAKNGPKLKEAVEEPPPPPNPDGSAPPAGPLARGAITFGKDGMPQLPPGAMRSGVMMMGGPNGTMRVVSKAQTMARFVDALSNQVDRPVVDQTGLDGKYDISLDFAPDMNRMLNRMGGGMGAMVVQAQAQNQAMNGGDAGAPNSGESNAPTIFSALQDQLGLKLESKKGPVDILVVDSAEKVPTEN